MNIRVLQDRRIFYILAAILLILLVLFVTLIARQKKITEEAGISQTASEQLAQSKPNFPLPRTKLADYTLEAELPELPTTVKLSDLKSTLTSGESLELANKMGFKNSLVEDGEGIILVTELNENGEQIGLFAYNKKTGNWVLLTENGLPTTGSEPANAAQAFLQKLGIWDSTMQIAATYKRASYPGITFVEIHRSWDGLGLPLLNPLGVLNLTENESLADVRLGYIESAAPDDPDVTESSDGSAGKVRPNQFNTITVGIADENNHIMNLTSNVKMVANTQQKSGSETLKTPEEALADLQAGKTTFSLAKPTGEGTIEIQNVFPEAQIDLQNAVIKEVVLTYIDEFGQKNQSTTLYPYYLFRGTAITSSGYDVQFVQTVSAVKQINTLGVFAQNAEVTVFPGQGNTLQYGTFNWLTPAPNPIQGLACTGISQIFQLPDGGYIGWYPNQPERNWYYIPPAGSAPDAAQFLEIKKVIRWEVAKACKGSINDPSICAFSDPTVNLQTACMFLGSGSPYIHIYSDSAKQLQLTLPSSVTYREPAFNSKNGWSFTAKGSKLVFTDGSIESKLYYEYDKKALDSVKSSLLNSKQGFLVNKDQLTEFVNTVADQTGLNSAEKADLLTELKREARKQPSDLLKVGLLDRKTADQLLPVKFSQEPDAYTRLLFYITSGQATDVLIEPKIEKIERSGSLVVVEVGAVGL